MSFIGILSLLLVVDRDGVDVALVCGKKEIVLSHYVAVYEKLFIF